MASNPGNNGYSNISENSPESILLNSQQILEHNEDIIAVIIENYQLGRYSDCLQHYSILHNNLINIITELDSYPSGHLDVSKVINSFPDNIMRKDVLDEIKPLEQRILPQSVLTPPCLDCFINKVSDYECRVTNKHVEPNYQFASHENDEFIRTATVLAYNHQNYIETAANNKPKRNYRRWTSAEIHTLLIAISVLGKDYEKLSKVLIERTPSMIRLFLIKNFTNEIIAEVMNGRLPPPPTGYYLPIGLNNLLMQLKCENDSTIKPTNNQGMGSLTEAVTQYYKNENNNHNLLNQNYLPYDTNNNNNFPITNSKLILPSLSSLPALSVPPPILPNNLNDPILLLQPNYSPQINLSHNVKSKEKSTMQKLNKKISNNIVLNNNDNCCNNNIINNKPNNTSTKRHYKKNRDGPYSISGRTKKNSGLLPIELPINAITTDSYELPETTYTEKNNKSFEVDNIREPISLVDSNKIIITNNEVLSSSKISNANKKDENKDRERDKVNHAKLENIINDNIRDSTNLDIQFTNEDDNFSMLDVHNDITLIAGLVNENSFM